MPAGKLTNDAPLYLSVPLPLSPFLPISSPLLSYHDSVPTFSLGRRTILVTIFIFVSPLPFLLRSIPSSFTTPSCIRLNVTGLIAASFGTVVYNGFYCKPKLTLFYCTTNMLCGALGSYLPFQRWFNERRNKVSFLPFFQRYSRGLIEEIRFNRKGREWEGFRDFFFCVADAILYLFSIYEYRSSFSCVSRCLRQWYTCLSNMGGIKRRLLSVRSPLPSSFPLLHLLSSLSPLLCYFTTCGIDD